MPPKKRAPPRIRRGSEELGGVLLSHDLSIAVPSALQGLTTVFGMGTGVTPPASPPGTLHTGALAAPTLAMARAVGSRLPVLMEALA